MTLFIKYYFIIIFIIGDRRAYVNKTAVLKRTVADSNLVKPLSVQSSA